MNFSFQLLVVIALRKIDHNYLSYVVVFEKLPNGLRISKKATDPRHRLWFGSLSTNLVDSIYLLVRKEHRPRGRLIKRIKNYSISSRLFKQTAPRNIIHFWTKSIISYHCYNDSEIQAHSFSRDLRITG